jgi:L-ribulose-5-phosphate 3-epimerase
MKRNEIGVFSTCTGIRDLKGALAAAKELELEAVQLQSRHLPDDCYSGEGARGLISLLDGLGLYVSGLCIVHEGERYDDLEAVERTVGYLPPETLSKRLEYSRRCIDLAAAMGAPLVTTHMGMLPKSPEAPGYQRLLGAVREVAHYCQGAGIQLALETGQETGTELLEFITRVGEEVKVNFDGANLIIYDQGHPLRALRALQDLIVHVHAKDALPPAGCGLLGEEVPLGEGKAELREAIRQLVASGYAGPFVMEIYCGTDRLLELRKGKSFLENCLITS